MRTEGESIFANLHLVEEHQRDAAKERAAKIFAEYRKLVKSVPHIETRKRGVGALLEAIETLRWEAERAADEDLESVETTVDRAYTEAPSGAASARETQAAVARVSHTARVPDRRRTIADRKCRSHLPGRSAQ